MHRILVAWFWKFGLKAELKDTGNMWKFDTIDAIRTALYGHNYYRWMPMPWERVGCYGCGRRQTALFDTLPELIDIFDKRHKPPVISLCPNCAINAYEADEVMSCTTGEMVKLVKYDEREYWLKLGLHTLYQAIRIPYFLIRNFLYTYSPVLILHKYV